MHQSLIRLLLFLVVFIALVNCCGYQSFNESGFAGASVKHRWLPRRCSSGAPTPKWRNISIEFHYDDSRIGQNPNFNERDVRDVSKFVMRAVKKYRSNLQVRELAKNTKVNTGTNCGNFDVTMYNSDFLLHVTVDSCPDTNTLAHAKVCTLEKIAIHRTTGQILALDDPTYMSFKNAGTVEWVEQSRGRPLAGQLTICEESFENRKVRADDDAWVSTILHEIGHALVFSPSLYRNFHTGTHFYDAGQINFQAPPVRPDCKDEECLYEIPGVVKKYQRQWEHSSGTEPRYVYMIVTPAAVNQAQMHFDCPTLEGVELENQGGQGNVFAHIEKRVFEHDTMTSTRTEINAWSKITMSIFEDSGWYKVYYDNADPMLYGQNKKCEFAKESCKAYVKNHQNPYPFCSKRREERCSDDFKAIEKCNIDFYAPPPSLLPKYRYFEPFNGNTALKPADFCPLYTVFKTDKAKNTKCTTPAYDDGLFGSGAKRDPQQQVAKKGQLQIYSKTARCFEVQGALKASNQSSEGSWEIDLGNKHACFEHMCANESMWVKTASSKFYQCFYAGQLIHIEKRLPEEKVTTKFDIVCPACNALCGQTFCVERKNSYPGRVGDEPAKKFSIMDLALGQSASTVDLLLLSVAVVFSLVL